MFAAMAAGLGQPLTAMQLLWINLISETSLGLALALEPPEPGLMEQSPRDPSEPIVRPADLKRMGFESLALSAGALGAYGYGVAKYGIGPRAGTLGFNALTAGQILHALPSRSEKYTILDSPPDRSNPILTTAVLSSLALQGAVFLIPFLRKLLGITQVSLADGLVMGAGAAVPLLINESAKRLARPKDQPNAPTSSSGTPE
jgi:Ca2+-transporting ATPase